MSLFFKNKLTKYNLRVEKKILYDESLLSSYARVKDETWVWVQTTTAMNCSLFQSKHPRNEQF